jgi:ABC-2 type transport system permease protein
MVSAPSISLEGKNLWIAKSLPVRALDVLMSKVEMHVLVCGIPAVVAAMICAVVLHVSALQFLIILIVPLLLTVLSAFFGVTINLHFPKFDWINELQPIKQSVSVLITMFGTFAFIAALVALYVFVLSPIISADIYMLLCAALLAVIIAVLYGYFKTGGSRRFEALN